MQKRVRIILCIFSAALSVLLASFVWIMLNASASEMRGMLLQCLLLITGVLVAAQIIYALKGQIFEYDGRLATRELLFSVIMFQCIMQFGFGFALYAVNQTALQNASYDSAYEHFIELQRLAADNTPEGYLTLDLEKNLPASIESVFLLRDGADMQGLLRFPITGGTVAMRRSQSYFDGQLREFAVNMLMSLIISVLLMVEIVYLMAKYLDNRIRSEKHTAPGYLRQFAFLFYFAGFLGASFVPILARNLYGDSPNANFVAGLPYSIEALFNCVAILVVAPIFRRYGWKLPYVAGSVVFASGLLLSSMAANVYFFIAARAIVGVGYGLCWMTLRSVATIGDESNRRRNFASLTSGTYAGVMSGVAFGAVLADNIGYSSVLFISALLSILALAFPMIIQNQKPEERAASAGKNIKLGARDIAVLAIFVVLIVVPACIADTFGDYAVPLYINDLGLPTAYVGRVTLVYNLCIVYLSSTIVMKIVVKLVKSDLMRNIVHMAFISLALIGAAFIGDLAAVLFAAAILGMADGFGFSAQNTYILNSNVSQKIGISQMLTYVSLFKKFAAMLGPMAFSVFLGMGSGGFAVMGMIFIGCAVTCAAAITLWGRPKTR